MTSLNLGESSLPGKETKANKVGFWSRQFQLEPTARQKKFDAFFGVILPVACFFFDPLIFRDIEGFAILGAYKPFAYLLSYFSILGMIGFLLLGEKLKWFNAVLSGLFFLAAIISLAIGIVLLPFSVIGLIMLIGALGFTPLFTSIVLLRSAVRAGKNAGLSLEKRVVWQTAMLSMIFGFCLPYLVNVGVTNSVKKMVNGDAQTVRETGERLRYIAPLVDLGPLMEQRYDRSIGEEKRQAIEETYRKFRGCDVRGVTIWNY